jgi:hypothetical protein
VGEHPLLGGIRPRREGGVLTLRRPLWRGFVGDLQFSRVENVSAVCRVLSQSAWDGVVGNPPPTLRFKLAYSDRPLRHLSLRFAVSNEATVDLGVG